MNLTDFNENKQRAVLEKLGSRLIEMAKTGETCDVDATLEHIQDGYLDVLGPEDFFGTEGWEYWLGL